MTEWRIVPIEMTETPDHSGKLISLAEETMLVGLVRQGNREAFDEIDRRYRGRLRRFLARHTTSPQHAEELAQQTLFKAFMSFETLQREDRLGGWLYRIAFRLAVDESRKPVTRFLDFEESQNIVDHREDDSAPETNDGGNLWTTARKVLKPNEYTAIWLKYVDGYSVDSIAKIMGKTRISIRVSLFRARKKLLSVLASEMSEPSNEID